MQKGNVTDSSAQNVKKAIPAKVCQEFQKELCHELQGNATPDTSNL